MSLLSLAKLTNRTVLRIKGPDCYPYLQSLITNDLRYLYEPNRVPKRKHARPNSSVLSTFMLNPQGRVICDMLIYRTPLTRYECEFTPPGVQKIDDELFIEVDSSLAHGLAETLYGYRVRRKIAINIENDIHVWALFPSFDIRIPGQTLDAKKAIESGQVHLKLENLPVKEQIDMGMILVPDPRLTNLGFRILTDSSSFEKLSDRLDIPTSEKKNLRDYTTNRCILGIGEGPKEHLETNCFPLECNADLLGSVSFEKGCYLGQELTARIHHTGVVRKRLMPILISDESVYEESPGLVPLIEGSNLLTKDGNKRIGVIRRVINHTGLALIRHESIDGETVLIHEGSGTAISTYKPYWWEVQ